jgi:hypothetical protein
VDKGITVLLLLLSNKEQTGRASHTHPGLQVPSALAPLTHAGAALVKGDAGVVHEPQWAASVLRFTSQPLLALPSQSPNLQTKHKERAISPHQVELLSWVPTMALTQWQEPHN